MVNDIKMVNFRHKAKLASGGHMTESSTTIPYASVVSRDTVRIALMITAIYDLEVNSANILNTFIS